MKLDTSKITIENLWGVIIDHAGEPFSTKKGLPFTYSIKGGELFTEDRKSVV